MTIVRRAGCAARLDIAPDEVADFYLVHMWRCQSVQAMQRAMSHHDPASQAMLSPAVAGIDGHLSSACIPHASDGRVVHRLCIQRQHFTGRGVMG